MTCRELQRSSKGTNECFFYSVVFGLDREVGAVSPAISLGYISCQCNDTFAEVAKQRRLAVEGVYFRTV